MLRKGEGGGEKGLQIYLCSRSKQFSSYYQIMCFQDEEHTHC